MTTDPVFGCRWGHVTGGVSIAGPVVMSKTVFIITELLSILLLKILYLPMAFLDPPCWPVGSIIDTYILSLDFYDF